MMLAAATPRLVGRAATTAAAFRGTSFASSSSQFLSFRGLATTTTMIGEKIPAVEMHQGFPPEKINLRDFCANKKVIMVGLPGAFTPTCSNQQIPNYMAAQDALRDTVGIDHVVIWAVNDAAVMKAWGKDQKLEESSMLQMMGDPAGELTKALDMELTHPGPISKGLFGRCKRHAIYVDDGIIKTFNVSEAENDPAGDDNPSNTLAEAVMAAIQNAKAS